MAAAVDAANAREAGGVFEQGEGYSRQLSCQIWSLQGTLVSRSESAPVTSLADHREGFAETEINGERWRVFAVINPTLGVRVLVGDSLEIRERLVGGVIKGLLLPALVILPMLALLIWFSVGRGLAPLNRIATSLSSRSATELHPLPEAPAPREIHARVVGSEIIARAPATVHRPDEAPGAQRRDLHAGARARGHPLAARNDHVRTPRGRPAGEGATAAGDDQNLADLRLPAFQQAVPFGVPDRIRGHVIFLRDLLEGLPLLHHMQDPVHGRDVQDLADVQHMGVILKNIIVGPEDGLGAQLELLGDAE
ncbi:MAG: sensor histidine kinase N-terminal domain-containing protein [Thermoflexus sp.]